MTKCIKVKMNVKTRTLETVKGCTIENWEEVQKKSPKGTRKIRDEQPNGPWKELHFVNRNHYYLVGMTPHHPAAKIEMEARNAEAAAKVKKAKTEKTAKKKK